MTPQELSSKRRWVLAALDQYEGRLARYARRLLSDEHAARDAVQHAFLRLCEQDPDQLGDRVAAWLFTVCRNQARDLARRNGRDRRQVDRAGEDCQLHEVAGREPEPPAAVEASELADCLRVLIDRLPAAQREAIDLWRESFSYHQIGEITERSAGAVRVLVHRALARLREHPQVKKLLDDCGAEPRKYAHTNGAARRPERCPEDSITTRNS